MTANQRILLYFPILHAGADLGQLAAPLERAAAAGDPDRRRSAVADTLWPAIEQAIQRLQIPMHLVFLYQDGLPVCGHELEIVNELARAGSANHRLLQALCRGGATLMGTESPVLLQEEYALAREIADAAAAGAAPDSSCRDRAAALLARRDCFVATRISESLPPGRVGMLFMGVLHRVAAQLPADITVSYPIGCPAESSQS